MKLPRLFVRSTFAALLASNLPADAAPPPKPLAQSPIVHDDVVTIRAELAGARELYLIVTDAGDGNVADWADWIEPMLVKTDGSRVKLTDLKAREMQGGWGKSGVDTRPDGSKPLRVKNQDVAFGFGAHSPSVIAFDLPPGVATFEARGAIDDGGLAQARGSSVVFEVYTQRPPGIETGGGTGKGYGLEAAKGNMASFTAAEGLSTSLFAAEPMIVNPTNIDIDPRGRVWAVECVNYRAYNKTRSEGDRVVILEDTNGDGAADTEKTFYQNPKLTNPLGICVLPSPTGKGTQAIVSAAPNVWLLTDKDGDDVAESATVIFKTTGIWDYDHQIHAFVFGPDGKFYFNFGDAATSLTWPDGKVVKDLAGNEINNSGKPFRKGMALRCDLDLATGKASNVEVLGHNFRNNYELCVDSFGGIWQSDNDDDGNRATRINYVMDYGNFGYTDERTGAGWQRTRTNLEPEIPRRHWYQNDPGVVPNMLITGAGSPAGILINEGAGLGARFQNQLIHCDPGPRTTRAYPVEKDGAGYKATIVDLLTSRDSWYRASDLAVAPDGALFIADWYDPGVGGHGMGDHTPGKMRGRIYRVAASGAKTAVAPAADASARLQSPNLATRSVAWRTLHAMGAKAEPELEKLWQSPEPRVRARALGLLAQSPNATKHLLAGLSDADSDVRCAAVRLIRMLTTSHGFDSSVLEENEQVVGKLLRDPSPQVRREIALSLHGAKDIAKLWAMLAMQHDGKDRWYLEALGIGAAGNDDACFDTWLAMTRGNWNTPAGRDIVWRVRSARAAGYLAKILEEDAVAAAEKPRYLRSFDFLPPSSGRTVALVELATSGKAADNIAREALVRLKGVDLNAEPAVAAAIQGVLAKAAGTAQFIELTRDFRVKGQGAALLATAVKIPGDPLAGEAVRLVFADSDSARIIADALATPDAAGLVNLLGVSSEKRALDQMIDLVKGTHSTLRQSAVRSLARTQAGAQALLKLAESGEFPEDLKLAAAGALALVQYPDLRDRITANFAMPNALGGQPLPPIAELMKLKGDAAHGKAIAERAESSCITCHRIGQVGADFGPALTEIGGKLPKEALFEAIIDPNAAVSMGFETWQFALKDGGAAMGLIRSETGDELVIALPGGAAQTLAKSNIVKREKLKTSMMPSGLNQSLAQQDLVDLVEYLASLKAAK